MAISDTKTAVLGASVTRETQADLSEKTSLPSADVDVEKKTKEGILDSSETKPAPPAYDGTSSDGDVGSGSDDVIIVTGADAAAHLLPLRDDGEQSLTFRALFLATCLSAFQAVMYQIYTVSTPPSLPQRHPTPIVSATNPLPSSSNPPKSPSAAPSSS